MHPIKEMAGGAALCAALLAVGSVGTQLGQEYLASAPKTTSVVKAPAPLLIDVGTRCAEDDPCWTWSRMGDRRRGVLVGGVWRVVTPCTYRKLRVAGLLDSATPRLRGDAWALANGCGAGATLAVHPSGVVEG